MKKSFLREGKGRRPEAINKAFMNKNQHPQSLAVISTSNGRSPQAFTLIELLVVIAIIAILV